MVVGKQQERLIGEITVSVGSSRSGEMEAYHKKHRLHVKVGNDAKNKNMSKHVTVLLSNILMNDQ